MSHAKPQPRPFAEPDVYMGTFVDGRLGFDLTTIPLPLRPVAQLDTGASFTKVSDDSYHLTIDEGSSRAAPFFQVSTVISKDQAKAARQLNKDVPLPGTTGCLSDRGRPVQAVISPYGKVIFTEVNPAGYSWIAVVTVPLRPWVDLSL